MELKPNTFFNSTASALPNQALPAQATLHPHSKFPTTRAALQSQTAKAAAPRSGARGRFQAPDSRHTTHPVLVSTPRKTSAAPLPRLPHRVSCAPTESAHRQPITERPRAIPIPSLDALMRAPIVRL